jgi:hypothetical protein
VYLTWWVVIQSCCRQSVGFGVISSMPNWWRSSFLDVRSLSSNKSRETSCFLLSFRRYWHGCFHCCKKYSSLLIVCYAEWKKNIWANIKVKQQGTWWMKDSSKYMLPTLRLLLKRWNYLKLKLHGLKLFIFINIKEKIVVDFSVGRRSNSTKTLFSPKFSITNKFRNNICLMKNGAVVVWVNFVDDRLHISISIELVLR